jgi:outer membrane protein assembly factor BamB
MPDHRRPHNRRSVPALTRRAALLLPVAALGGCSLWDSWFGIDKPPLPGTRVAVMGAARGLQLAPGTPRQVTLPQAVANPDWPQPGGDPAHGMGRLACGDGAARAWTSDIGEGGGYRQKITAQPVIAGGHVFTMDSDAVVSAFDVTSGSRAWRTETQAEEDRSTNVGGGIAEDGGTLYASTGRSEVLALEAATGTIRWRGKLPNAARSAPTIADGRVYVATLDDQVVALAVADGKRLWAQQAAAAEAAVLGLGAPAYSDGLVVAGFGSGDLLAMRAASGGVAWSDSLASTRGRTSMADFSTIRGMVAIKDGTVYAIGYGGLMLAIDLRTGRRLWERDVGSSETPWLAGDWLFIVSQDAQVAAISRTDGAVAWVTQLDRYEDMEKLKDPIRWIGPVLAGDRLVLVGTNSSLVALNPVTGAVLGSEKLSDKPSVTPVVAGGTMFVVTDNGKLTAFR